IYVASHWKCTDDGLDSRFRGNDGCSEMDPIPNDIAAGVQLTREAHLAARAGNAFSSRLSHAVASHHFGIYRDSKTRLVRDLNVPADSADGLGQQVLSDGRIG